MVELLICNQGVVGSSPSASIFSMHSMPAPRIESLVQNQKLCVAFTWPSDEVTAMRQKAEDKKKAEKLRDHFRKEYKLKVPTPDDWYPTV